MIGDRFIGDEKVTVEHQASIRYIRLEYLLITKELVEIKDEAIRGLELVPDDKTNICYRAEAKSGLKDVAGALHDINKCVGDDPVVREDIGERLDH